MTRAEYLEFIEERLCFPNTGVGSPDPGTILYDHEAMVQALHAAHTDYCRRVAQILQIDREYSESGGPEDKPNIPGWEVAEQRMRDLAPEIFEIETGIELPVRSRFQEFVNRVQADDADDSPSTVP